MPIFDGMGNYVETALERDARMKLEISYQHTHDERPYEVLSSVAVPNTTSFFLGAMLRPSVLNASFSNLGTPSDSSVIFSEGTIFQTEIAFDQPLVAPGQYQIDYHSGQVRTFSTPSGIGVVTFAWSPFPYFILPAWYEFSDPLCMHVCPICAHGNVSSLVTGTGVGFASSPFYGGTHASIFVYTGFPVECALVAFEKEYDMMDVQYIYYYQSIARAASIRVGATTDIGFFVEFHQPEDAPWVLEFNWIATGCRRATSEEPCACCEGEYTPPQNSIVDPFDGLITITEGGCEYFDGIIEITCCNCDYFNGLIHIGYDDCDQFDGFLRVCVTYCCIVYDTDFWFNRMCPYSPTSLSDTKANQLLVKVRQLSSYFDSVNLSNRMVAAAMLRNTTGDTDLDRLHRFYLANLLNIAVGALPLGTAISSSYTLATTMIGVITDVDNILINHSSDPSEVERVLNLNIDITLQDATICLKINEESWEDEGDINPPEPCDPPEPCGECSGKVTELTLQYLGSIVDADIEVVQKKPAETIFHNVIQPNGQFSFVGVDRHGTMSTEVSIFVNGSLNVKIHTSCSQPIGPGLIRGDFEVITGRSRNGGLLCPVSLDDDDEWGWDDHGHGGGDCDCEEDAALPLQISTQGVRRIVMRAFHRYQSGPYVTTVEAFRGHSIAINRRIDIEACTTVPSGAVDANTGGRSGNIAILYTQLDQFSFDVTATPEPKGRGALPTNISLRATVREGDTEQVYGPVVIHTSGSQPLSVGMQFGPFEIVEIEKTI